MVTGKPLPDVWADRDFPVLVEVARRIDGGQSSVRIIADDLGMEVDDVARAGAALARRGLLATEGVDQRPVLFLHDLSGTAYLMTGLHPDGDDAVSRLISALEQAIERTSDEGKRGRLRRLADSFKDAPREVVGAVIASAIGTGVGIT
jgi:hypothetical protein